MSRWERPFSSLANRLFFLKPSSPIYQSNTHTLSFLSPKQENKLQNSSQTLIRLLLRISSLGFLSYLFRIAQSPASDWYEALIFLCSGKSMWDWFNGFSLSRVIAFCVNRLCFRLESVFWIRIIRCMLFVFLWNFHVFLFVYLFRFRYFMGFSDLVWFRLCNWDGLFSQWAYKLIWEKNTTVLWFSFPHLTKFWLFFVCVCVCVCLPFRCWIHLEPLCLRIQKLFKETNFDGNGRFKWVDAASRKAEVTTWDHSQWFCIGGTKQAV